MGHQEQHLEFIDAAAAHMSAYDDNPRAQARAILRMDGADLRTRNEEELATSPVLLTRQDRLAHSDNSNRE